MAYKAHIPSLLVYLPITSESVEVVFESKKIYLTITMAEPAIALLRYVFSKESQREIVAELSALKEFIEEIFDELANAPTFLVLMGKKRALDLNDTWAENFRVTFHMDASVLSIELLMLQSPALLFSSAIACVYDFED